MAIKLNSLIPLCEIIWSYMMIDNQGVLLFSYFLILLVICMDFMSVIC